MNLYPKISKILSDIEENKISFKNAIYKHVDQNKDRHFKTIYKLVIEVLKNKKTIDDIIKTFFNEDIKDVYFFMILIYEKFFSDQAKQKKMGGKLMKILKEKEEKVKRYLNEMKKEENNNASNDNNERIYFRVNLQKENFDLDKNSRDKYNKDDLIEGLYYINKTENPEQVKEIFEKRDNNEIIIQTKSSCLPAYLLKKLINQNNSIDSDDKFDIIDCCSAPGNKTLQLAEYFYKHQSKIYAYEINKERYTLLNQNVKKNNFRKNIITKNEDFLNTDPSDPLYYNVKVILADPSCSGSGTSNNNLVDASNLNTCCKEISGSSYEQEQINRLNRLAKFQTKIIEHCMKFPNVKFISYSTCSIFMTENEHVVEKILKNNPQFKLANLRVIEGSNFPDDFHNGMTEETKETLRVCRKCNGVDGFYVAIFEKINN